MARFDYDCEGQINITDYFKSKIELRQVDDFTSFLNKQGKSQYQQIGQIITDTYQTSKNEPNLLDRLTNNVSVYVLQQSLKYSNYLRSESKL